MKSYNVGAINVEMVFKKQLLMACCPAGKTFHRVPNRTGPVPFDIIINVDEGTKIEFVTFIQKIILGRLQAF